MNKNAHRKSFLIILFAIVILSSWQIAKARASSLFAAPNIRVSSTVTDINNGSLLAGDTVEYTFTITNIGDATATSIVFTNTIPTNTTYVAGSMQINSVSKTDSGPLLSDEAEYSGGSRLITMRLGTGATNLTGGTLLSGGSTVVKFRVQINAGTATGTAITNQANVAYSSVLLIDSYNSLSDSDPIAPDSQSSVVYVNSSPPSVNLVHSISPAGDQSPGTDITYTSIFTNSGGSQAQGFSIVESVPENTYFKINSAVYNLSTTGLTPYVQYSNDNGLSYSYTPSSGAGGAPSGYDANVSALRFVFVGLLSSVSPNNTGSVGFSARIK